MRRLWIVLLALSVGTAAAAQGFAHPTYRPHGFGNPPAAERRKPDYQLPQANPTHRPSSHTAIGAPLKPLAPIGSMDQGQGSSAYKPLGDDSSVYINPYKRSAPRYGSTY